VTGKSIPGKGTKWPLWLPAWQVQSPAPLATPALASAGIRVLLVEDEEAVRTMLTEWLVRDHLEVTAVASAEEAVGAHAAGEFDVLVTDVGLPRVNGPALARTIQARTPGIRVIFISGYVADSLGRRGIDSGASFQQKPFSPRELARRVSEMVPRLLPQD
jgi:two-component system cell cycle sensor histidine kinase/response regulator CckA